MSPSVATFDDSDSDGRPSQRMKSSGACVHCKSLKVRCEFTPGEKICQRCQAGGYDCVARSRKKRKPAPTHEDLQERAHSQDCQIQSLLQEFDKRKAERRMKQWVTAMDGGSMSSSSSNASLYSPDRIKWATHGERAPEVAAISYFSSDQTPKLLSVPDIVRCCALYPQEIQDLFSIYFDKINPMFSLLVPELHTAGKLIWTSPFLFTAICATAARHYHARPELYHLATHFARDAAGKALVDGSKSVEVCQAYLILSVYPVPKRKWDEDRSWIFMGVAIRMAIELELHQQPPKMMDEREALNRTRTWLNCYCVDGSHATQFGKTPMVRWDDYLARGSGEWYRRSKLNQPFDVHLCAYVQLLIIMAEWRASIEGRNLRQRYHDSFDVVKAALDTERKLSEELQTWVSRYAEEYTYQPLLICAYRGNTTQMITAYLRVVVLAAAFQHSSEDPDSEVLMKAVDAARTVIQITLERLYPTGHFRIAMEANFLYISFAAAFLVNLLRAKFSHLIDEEVQENIVSNVSRLIIVLQSKEVALDGRHTPMLYAKFLSNLLEKNHLRPQRSPSSVSSGSDGDPRYYSSYRNDRHTGREVYTTWPDVLPHSYSASMSGSARLDGDMGHVGDADMDLSLNHFVRSVTGVPMPYQHHTTLESAWPQPSWAFNS